MGEAPSGSGFTAGSPKKAHAEKGRRSLLPIVGPLVVAAVAAALSGHLHLSRFPPMSFRSIPVHESLLPHATGRFVKLSRGTVHYTLHRPEAWDASQPRQPPLVLIHGFSLGSQIWSNIPQQVAALTNRTVLTFDLYGRGLSDAAFPNDVHLFTGQLSELLFSLQQELGPGPYDVLGTSMGGAIATYFANTYPHLLRRLVLVAPAGLPVHIPLTARLIKLPLLGDLLMPLLGPSTLKQHGTKNYAQPNDPALVPMRQVLQVALDRQIAGNPGFFLSLLSTIRNFPLGEMRHVYEELGKKEEAPHTLLIWGDQDGVCPYDNAHETKRLLGESTRLVTLEGCGHVDMLAHPHYRDTHLVPLVADYLLSSSSSRP